MSYILDALRKSDQQRQRGVLPTLQSPPATETARGRGVSPWQTVTVVALIGVGIAIGALRPWHTDAPDGPVLVSKRPETSEAVAPPSPPPPQKEAAVSAMRESPPAARTLPATPPAPKPIPKAAESRPVVATVTQSGAKTATTARDAPAAVTKEPLRPPQQTRDATAPAEPAPEQKVVAVTDLPTSIRDEMPKMTITVHAYSREPKDRLVGINDRVLHEGESPAPGLTLEQITPDGMIMSYKGYRFQRGVR